MHLTLLILALLIVMPSHASDDFDTLYNNVVNSADIQMAEDLLKKAQGSSLEENIARSFFLLAYLQYNEGMYYDALNNYFLSLRSYRKTKNKAKIAATTENIGIIYRTARFYDKALEFYLQALKAKLELSDSSGIAGSYYNIGRIYRLNEQYQEALQYLGKALTMYKSLGNTKKVSHSYNEIGIVNRDLGHFSTAEDYYRRSRDVYKFNSDEYLKRESLMLNNLGDLMIEQGEYQLAKKYLDKAVSLEYLKHIKKDILSLAYSNLAKVHQQLGKDSINYLLELSVDVYPFKDFNPDIYESCKILADYYWTSDQHDLSKEYYDKIYQLGSDLSKLQSFLEDANLRYQVEAANYKITSQLKAEAAEYERKKGIVVNGIVSLIAFFILIVIFKQQLKKKKERRALLKQLMS